MKKKIPTYEFIITDDQEFGIEGMGVVDSPAFQSKAKLSFSEIAKQFITLADDKGKKRKICGLALIPNVLVYRIDEVTGEEYNGFFSAETIKKLVEKFHADLNNNKVDYNHDENIKLNAVLVEDFIIDSPEKVKVYESLGFKYTYDLGAWYTKYDVKDDNDLSTIEMSIAQGNPLGFSVEVYIDRVLIEMNNTINKNKIKMTKNKKTLFEKLMIILSNKSLADEIMSAEIFERGLVSELGFEIEWTEVGKPVNKVIVGENGTETLAPIGPGEFATDAGIVSVDDSSNLVEVRELPPPPTETPALEETPAPESNETPATGMTATEELKIENGEVVLEETIVPEVPAVVEETPAPDVKAKTIGDVVGTNDGEYWIKVTVEGGLVTEAEVSSETDLLKTKVSELSKQNTELLAKLEEPIGDPILAPIPEVKPFEKMSAFEKAMYQRNSK